MNDDVKRQFIRATLHFKKVDMCELARGGIPFGEMVVMGWVQQRCPAHGGCLNVAEIASQLCVSRPAVSQILSSLEGKGYIVRQIDPADRRRITVVSTEEGAAALEDSQRRYDDAVDRFLASMTMEELETLIRLMNRLTNIYNDLRSNPE
ncbi:MarR family transcriptional regulator [Ruminococcaceae bacterium OttesenSCG-928-A11]|nr:MarR family transcriptional regulator [Ruminococcaceae bacterium OttesenSCG-928-A11]